MANISFSLNTGPIQELLKQLSEVVDKPRPLMLNIAETLHAQSMEMFKNEGYPANSWQNLAKSTQRQRAKKGHWPGKKLQVSGQLIGSIQTDAGDDYAAISTNKVYAAIQNLGGEIKRTGTVRLRTNANGELKRQENHPNLAVFASKKHKRAVERAVSYTIKIPARPFMPATDTGLTKPAYNAVMKVLHDALSLGV
ncbi:phage virion morphogenesis protein [Salmonella enterica]